MERRADKKNEDVGWTSDYTGALAGTNHLYAPVGSGEGEEEVEYQVTAWRWWVLFVFSFASFLQSLVWFTFSSVPKVAKEYYPGTAHTAHDTRHTLRSCHTSLSANNPNSTQPGVDEGTIDLLLNWGAIVFIPVLPYVSWLQTRPNGLLIAFWQVRVFVCVCVVCVCVCV